MILDRPRTDDDWRLVEQQVRHLFSSAPLISAKRSGHAPEGALFGGRALVAQRMMEAVRDPARHIILYGERGIGKTSLSNTFWTGLDTIEPPTFVARVQAYPSDTFASLWKRVLDELRTAGQSYCRDLQTNYTDVSPDIIRLELHKMDRDAKPLVVVDEFDLLRSRDARETTANLIKTLHDYAMQVTIILIGVAEDVGELIIDHQSLRRALLPVKLERMSSSELEDILDARLRQLPLEISINARSALVSISTGLPYYIQILGKYAAESSIRARRGEINTDDVHTAIRKFVAESAPTFADAYQTATQGRQTDNGFSEVLLACAIAPSDMDGFFNSPSIVSSINLINFAKERKELQIQGYLAKLSSDLRGNVLIKRRGESSYKYRFSDATMRPFIIMKGILDQTIPNSALGVLSNLSAMPLGEPEHASEIDTSCSVSSSGNSTQLWIGRPNTSAETPGVTFVQKANDIFSHGLTPETTSGSGLAPAVPADALVCEAESVAAPDLTSETAPKMEVSTQTALEEASSAAAKSGSAPMRPSFRNILRRLFE